MREYIDISLSSSEVTKLVDFMSTCFICVKDRQCVRETRTQVAASRIEGSLYPGDGFGLLVMYLRAPCGRQLWTYLPVRDGAGRLLEVTQRMRRVSTTVFTNRPA